MDFDLFQTAVYAASRVEGFLQIVNLSRQTLEQTGDGHFCPIGGFNLKAQKVLLMDTARFKYPPHWVDIDLLFDAMRTLDTDTQKQRGFIMLSKKLSKSIKKTLPIL
jgi:glutathione gamma-glutamylcysteinyltransferase